MSTLEAYFVEAFPLSTTRPTLWRNYQQYISDFSREVTTSFTQWLDGSFFTQTINPKDIDLVTFVDTQIFRDKKVLLEKYWSFSLEDQKIDAYLVEVHSSESDQYTTITENFRRAWQNRFGRDREGHSKGFIQIDW
ncbi:MAG: hypothetical protein WA958_16865 [Tunicatimonas sp.]